MMGGDMQRTRWLVVWFAYPGWPDGRRHGAWFTDEKKAKAYSAKVGGTVKLVEGR